MGSLEDSSKRLKGNMKLLLLLLPLALACKRTTLTTTTPPPPPLTTTTTTPPPLLTIKTTTPLLTTTTTTTTTTSSTASTPGHVHTRPADDPTTTTTTTTTTTATTTTTSTQPDETTPAETTPQAPIDCPDGWIDETAVGLGCLRFVEELEGMNWLETQTTCQSEEYGNSVEALSMDEAEKLFEIAQLTSFFSHREVWWLGLSDLVSEGRWTWSNSYDVEVNTAMYSDIWTPGTGPRNSICCVVMTVGNNSQLVWKDIPCLSEEYESKPIQAVC